MTVYFPGGILIMNYSPFMSAEDPMPVDSMITLQPTSGPLLFKSVIVPAILPVVPAAE